MKKYIVELSAEEREHLEHLRKQERVQPYPEVRIDFRPNLDQRGKVSVQIIICRGVVESSRRALGGTRPLSVCWTFCFRIVWRGGVGECRWKRVVKCCNIFVMAGL